METIQLVGNPHRVEPVEKCVGVGVRPHGHQPGRQRVRERRPRRRATAVREPSLRLDELGRDEEGGGYPVVHEHGEHLVHEVSGPVIEGHHDVTLDGLGSTRDRQRRGRGLSLVHSTPARPSARRTWRGADRRTPRFPADPDGTEAPPGHRGRAHGVDHFRDDLHDGSRYSHPSRIGRLPPMLSQHRKVKLVSESTIRVRRASPDDIKTAVEIAGTALSWDPTEPMKRFFGGNTSTTRPASHPCGSHSPATRSPASAR